MQSLQRIICLAVLSVVGTAVARADTVSLVSNRDTTIYQGNPSNSDGAGQAMFVGNTGVPSACRGLIGFDIAGNIPAGSTITGVQLSLVLVLTAPSAPTSTSIELHRLLGDWGEGTSGQGSGAFHGGQGFSTAADGTTATWSHRFYNTTPWTNPGGDFAATASGSTMVGSDNIAYSWDSNANPGMVQDVQSWLDNPSGNFGWVLLGDESAGASARVFNTRETQSQGGAPALLVTFTPASPATTQLVVSAPPGTTAGSPFQITVSAMDSSGQVNAGYTGTVAFTTSDSSGVLPATYTFTSNDQGTHTFDGVTLFTAGAQTLTVQDTANSAITSSATVTVTAAPANHLLITASSTALSGVAFDVTLAAADPFGNVDMTYAGTVTWTGSDTDPGVILPLDYPFQASDAGMHIFSGGVTLITLGDQTLTATDTVSGITGTATVTVGAGP
jgi:hypothetical protein